jgi:hypothetical protein
MMSRIKSSPDTTYDFQTNADQQPVYVKSIFSTHKLQTKDFQVKQMQKNQSDWELAILLLCFVLLAWVQVFYHKRIRQIFRAPFSKRFINQLTRDGNLFSERIAIALGVIYFLTFALFLYEFNQQILGINIQGITGITFYGLVSVIIIGLIAVKIALVKFLGVIFKTREVTNNYLLNLMIFSLLSGPVLLISLVLIIYLKSVVILYISIVLFILILLFRFMRGFFIGMALTKFSYLFLFVYLCSLEILPLLVLVKILLTQAQAAGE